MMEQAELIEWIAICIAACLLAWAMMEVWL
jgi:hypothetical protein